MISSEKITNIVTALISVQKELGGAMVDKQNPYFKSKYATLESVINTIKEPLNKNSIIFLQIPDIGEGGKTILITRIIHSSGEWIEGRMELLSIKNDPQGQGSAISYARRYMLNSMLGLYQEDDDGNRASIKPLIEKEPEKKTEKIEPEKPKVDLNMLLTEIQSIQTNETLTAKGEEIKKLGLDKQQSNTLRVAFISQKEYIKNKSSKKKNDDGDLPFTSIPEGEEHA